MSNVDDLAKRIASLEAELAQLKAEVKPMEDVPKPTKPWPRYDPTEQMRMPPNAVKAMTAVVPEMRDRSKLPDTRRASYPEPGGFGPPKTGSEPVKPRGSGWVEPRPLEPPSGVKICDQMMDVQDAIDKAELKRRLGGGYGGKR
jgi:hypothetical protein